MFENVGGLVNLGLDDCVNDLEDLGYAVRVLCVPACATGAPHRRDRLWIVAHTRHNESQGREEPAPDHEGCGRERIQTGGESTSRCGEPALVAHTQRQRQQGQGLHEEPVNSAQGEEGPATEPIDGRRPQQWPPECGLGGAVDGVSQRLDEIRTGWLNGTWEVGIPRVTTGQPDRAKRLKALGNAQVPQVVYEIAKAIMAAERENNELPQNKRKKL